MLLHAVPNRKQPLSLCCGVTAQIVQSSPSCFPSMVHIYVTNCNNCINNPLNIYFLFSIKAAQGFIPGIIHYATNSILQFKLREIPVHDFLLSLILPLSGPIQLY
ncbi:unnamed protein product [Meganyctiphanes norvegica]|uniref:Uncharacterized protein n=1 Tax=Meganyctiphanes norvegica TaxID=48144 RepID=A0AAV2QTU3_MEGNR